LTLNVAVVLPAAIVTVEGTVAALELLLREMMTPPVAAVPLIVTVPVADVPPTTVDGATETETRDGGVTVSPAVRETVPVLAVIVALFCAATAVVLTVKLAPLLPAATVTVAGTVAAALLLDKLTTTPPVPALPLRLTVPLEVAPPATVVGLRLNCDNAGGVSVSVAVCETAPSVALMVAEVCLLTPVVMIANVAELLPAPTVTVLGTTAEVLLLDNVTVTPEGPASPVSVTVPIAPLPPTSEVGLTVTDPRVAGVTARVADSLEVPTFAVIVEAVWLLTGVVVIVNVADAEPVGTVTVAGTELLPVAERLITIPPRADALVRVTVPVAVLPPATEVGETLTLLIVALLASRAHNIPSPPSASSVGPP